MKRCMYCGHENEDSLDTCAVCGNKLVDVPETADTAPADAAAEEDIPAGAEEGAGPAEDAPVPDAPEDAPAADAVPGDEAADGGELQDEAMTTQAPAFAGQAPVNEQFGETTPGGQFPEEEQGAAPVDNTPGYGADWRQDVGRGQTYGARQQYEARNGRRGDRPQRDQYGSGGYGYRQPGGQEGGRPDYGRRDANYGGSKAFMIRARKRVKSVTFFLMALFFTAMLAANVWNIYTGNAMRNIKEADTLLADILGSAGRNFFTQMISELASQMVSMIVNVSGIISQLGKTVEMAIMFVVLIPNVLYALGLWLMFFQTDTKRRQFSLGGYTLARVMMVLKFLIACLVMAVGLVISVYFVVVGAQRSASSSDSSLFQGITLLILMIVLSVFVVMYYIQWMFCLKVVKVNAKTGADPGKMPAFVGFLSLICCALCVLMMIPMASNDYYGLAARGAAAGYFLFSGLWVFLYKILVKRR